MQEDRPSNRLVNPFDLDSADGYVWLKANFHSHTTNSDGKPSPQERLDGYVAYGYDALCLSDHHKITRIESVQAPTDFVLVQGVELHPDNSFGGQRHHFLCLNLREDMDATTMAAQHVIDQVNEQGGTVWLAHPHWSSINIIRDTLPLSGFAGIEVFNTLCRTHGRGESSVIWDDWMDLENRLYPALANDDSHSHEREMKDTYQGWTMVRVRERTADAVCAALRSGACYGSTGPEIHDIQMRRIQQPDDSRSVVEATVRCSEAQRITVVHDRIGIEYRERGKTFEVATFPLRPGARWARVEVVGPDGSKAWANPVDLTGI